MEIQNYLSKFSSYKDFSQSIIETKIKTKTNDKYPNLVLLYVPFKVAIDSTVEIEKWCRSVIIDIKTLKIVSFSYPKIHYNDYVLLTNCEIKKEKKLITECLEGTLLSFFNYNNNWIVSTRKCIDAEDSKWRNSKSHMVLFHEAIKELNTDWKTFCNVHDPNYIYTYILVHHENIQLIDYTENFGSKYKKLILSLIRDKETLQPHVRNHFDFFLKKEEFMKNLIISKELDDYSLLDEVNETDDLIDSVKKIKQEGLLVSFESDIYIKLHNNAYKTFHETSNLNYFPTSSQHYISLYQSNMLDNYFNKFSQESMYNDYQVKGLIDNVFKLLTTEFLFLFKFLWDIKFGTQKQENKEIYNDLPTEYKKFFYLLRGIYFKKKMLLNENKYITIKVVYELLKETSPHTILLLLQERKEHLCNKSKKIYDVLNDYHKTENVEKLTTTIDVAVDFCLTTAK
jgi:hypothetical protein